MEIGEIVKGQDAESVKAGLEELLAQAKPLKSFRESVERNEVYYNGRRKKYIVQTEFINRKFGQLYYLMPSWLSRHLADLGGKRTTRQVYDGKKRVRVVSVWVFEK